VPVASFTVTKLRWLAENEPAAAARTAAVCLPHDWLTWRLRYYGPADASPLGPDLAQLTTDRSDVSGTGYWNPATGEYDLELFRLAFGRCAVEAGDGVAHTDGSVILPRVLAPGDSAGSVHSSIAGEDVLLGAGAGDNAAAALGLGARAGDVVVSVGTSGTVFAVSDAPVGDPSGTVAGFADASGLFLPITVTLNAARVLTSVAGLLDVDFDELARLALEAEPGAGGVVLVPYFEGERTPNLPHATASFSGLTIASTTRNNFARAAVEGMLCGLAGGLDALRALGHSAERLLLIGGAVQNPAVQRIAAQVFDLPVLVPSPGEYVARGAAVQAAWALTGERPEWEVALDSTPEPDFRPAIAEQYRAEQRKVAQAPAG